jgi:hypothetical protein
MGRWRGQTDGGEVLVVGAENNPFQFHSRKAADDTADGKDEILPRRIGDNELAAVDVMTAMADAQAQYLPLPHDGVKQYAQKFISDEGKQKMDSTGNRWKDSLKARWGRWWHLPLRKDSPRSQASSSHFMVTFYRVLTKQGADTKGGTKDFVINGKMTGGFAFIAFPEKYDDTGITTFIINQDGVAYQKNLGKTTMENAMAMKDSILTQAGLWRPNKHGCINASRRVGGRSVETPVQRSGKVQQRLRFVRASYEGSQSVAALWIVHSFSFLDDSGSSA